MQFKQKSKKSENPGDEWRMWPSSPQKTRKSVWQNDWGSFVKGMGVKGTDLNNFGNEWHPFQKEKYYTDTVCTLTQIVFHRDTGKSLGSIIYVDLNWTIVD